MVELEQRGASSGGTKGLEYSTYPDDSRMTDNLIPSPGNVCGLKLMLDHELFEYWLGDVGLAARNALGILEGVNRLYGDNGPILRRGNGTTGGDPVRFRAEEIFVATGEFCNSTQWGDFRCSRTSNCAFFCLLKKNATFTGVRKSTTPIGRTATHRRRSSRPTLPSPETTPASAWPCC